MAKFRKKPVVVEAVQLRWTTWNEVCDFLGGIVSPDNPAREVATYSDTCGEQGPGYIEIDVPTIHGDMATVRHGDWIIAEPVPGRFYPCKPEVFAATYEPVPDAD